MPDWDKILAQVAIVTSAPAPFIVALLIVAGFIWWAIDWKYSAVLTHRDAEISRLKGERDDYKDKLSGATPDQAKARIDALEARLSSIEPRRLTASQRAALIAGLASPPPGSIVDVMSEPSGDNTQFAADIWSVFQQAGGWSVGDSTAIGPSNRPPSGLAIRLADLQHPSQGAVTIMNLFRAQNIRFDIQQDTRLQTATVLLLICAKPD